MPNKHELVARITYSGETGHILALFIIAVAAAEAAVGLAIIIAVFRHRQTINADELRLLRW
jgi:NADH-quinone oxidoreductase subunit K